MILPSHFIDYFIMTTVFSENESSTELLFLRMKIKPVQTTIHLIFILYNHDRIWHYCWLKTSIGDLTLHMSHLVDATAFRSLLMHSNYIKMYYQVLVKKRHKKFCNHVRKPEIDIHIDKKVHAYLKSSSYSVEGC